MKRLFALVLMVCLLLTGCGKESGNSANEAETKMTIASETESTTAPITESASTTAQTTPTTTPTEVPDEPQPTMVTVYLLETEMYCDSGKMTFVYDGQYNLESAVSWTIENDLRYVRHFEEQDDNGMPCKIRDVWSGDMIETVSVSYFADGKIDSYQYDGLNFSGYQCAYDQKGDLSEKREYYDGIRQSTVICEYDGETLVSVRCEDPDGNVIYDTVIENGLIVERNVQDFDYPYGYRYEYDENGNLTASYFVEEGMENVTSQYTYKAVEVEYSRALYLMEQQKLIQSII